MTGHATAHTSFELERRYPASPERVFAAWASADAKRRWSACHPRTTDYELDFRAGGSESCRMETDDGLQHFRADYFDVVPDARIVYAYELVLDGRRLSVSLVTVAFAADDGGTRMTFTEQVAYLDGYYDRERRIHGTGEGLDRLALEFGTN